MVKTSVRRLRLKTIKIDLHVCRVQIIVRLSTAKQRTLNVGQPFVVCHSVRDVRLFKLPDDTAELGTYKNICNQLGNIN